MVYIPLLCCSFFTTIFLALIGLTNNMLITLEHLSQISLQCIHLNWYWVYYWHSLWQEESCLTYKEKLATIIWDALSLSQFRKFSFLVCFFLFTSTVSNNTKEYVISHSNQLAFFFGAIATLACCLWWQQVKPSSSGALKQCFHAV